MAMERALMSVQQGEYAPARKEVEDMLRMDETAMPVWRLLADVLVQSQAWTALESTAQRLRGIKGGGALAAEIQATIALRNADVDSARRYYAEALTEYPLSLSLLRRLLRLELMAGKMDAAQGYATTILRMDGGDPLANYVIGVVRLAEREMDLAEDSLRRSIAGDRLPEALNDLAWLLLEKKAYAEAETLAREATERSPTLYQAWDTLGGILMKQGRLAEAENALQKALSLSQNSVSTFLHMAQLQAAKGDKQHAREILLMIADLADRLSSTDRVEYDSLKRNLTDG
jgi:Tfp pilus assembly protein PilF